MIFILMVTLSFGDNSALGEIFLSNALVATERCKALRNFVRISMFALVFDIFVIEAAR